MPPTRTIQPPGPSEDPARRALPVIPAERSIVLPGRGTTFVHESEGPPGAPTVILLHGLGANASLNWSPSFPALGRRFHVVAPDHRGHGRGIRTSTRFTLEDASDDVVALADVLGLERFVVVGYSMGGPIAQLVWRRHRDRVSGLVLCATSHRFRDTPFERAMFGVLPALEQASRIVPGAGARRVFAQVLATCLPEGGLAESVREVLRWDPRTVLRAAAALGSYTADDWIGDIDVPTAVLVHTCDQLVPPARQVELASAIPGAVAHFVDADHFAVVRAPRRFTCALVQAIRDVVRDFTLTSRSTRLLERAS